MSGRWPGMGPLAEFLLARLGEDEKWARFVLADIEGGRWYWTVDGENPEHGPVTAYHPASHGPDRVLADVRAKRRIVNRLTDDDGEAYGPDELADLRDLASVYSDHPAYRDEWRP